MLGDAARLGRGNVGRADGVEQRGLAVVDVAHDGDDGRARQQARRIVGGIEHAFFDVGLGDAAYGVAEFLGKELRGIGVDRVGDLRHMALFHQEPNHVDGALGHAVGQLLDRDRLRNGHFADDLLLRLAVAMPGHALDAAAERRDRTFALLIGGKGGDDGEPPAALFRGSAGWFGGGRRTWCRAAAADAPRCFLLVGFERRARARLRCRRSIGAEALLGDLVGLAFGFFVVLAAFFFVAFARFRLRTFRALGFLAALADAGLFFGDLALLGLAQAGVGERVRAGAPLLVRERAQHDAGRLGRRGSGAEGRRGRRCRRRRFGGDEAALGHGAASGGRHGFRLGLAGAGDTALYLLDDDRLAATMAEALAHHALLDAATLERQRLRRGHAQLFAGILGRLSHTHPFLYAFTFLAG